MVVLMASHAPRKPVVLCVLDGWGWSDDHTDNAIVQADTLVFDRMLQQCPNSLLKTCGTDVGLPAGQMGNSEVGHLNLGQDGWSIRTPCASMPQSRTAP